MCALFVQGFHLFLAGALPVFERRLLSPLRVLLWSGTGLLQRVVHNAAHHLPGPAPQHLHGHLRDGHLCLHPQPHLLLLLHQVSRNDLRTIRN